MYLNLRDKSVKRECSRCGTCCKKGGPILHLEDKTILLKGIVTHKDLVTLRKGEFVFNPLDEKIQKLTREVIKVDKKGEGWTCIFYNELESSCNIYENRFLECRILKCWDAEEFLRIFCKNTLTRFDMINSNDPVIEIIREHDKECPCDRFETLIINYLKRGDSKTLFQIKELINKDIRFRLFAFKELGVNREYERFIFGRSFIELAKTHGISIKIERNIKHIV
jgi:Fe-S-cluster containining protein